MEEKKATIVFERESHFYGSLISIKVLLDGKEVAKLADGEKAKIETTIGKHQVAFDLWSGDGKEEIEIKEENPNIKVTFKLKIGLITTKPKIVSITNL